MKVIETALEGVVILEPELHRDARGYFFESFSRRAFDEAVRPVRFVQDNESKSSYGVLRGLHFQKPPHAQSKLVRVISGTVLDVGRGHPPRLADFRPPCGRRAFGREPPPAVHPPRIRATGSPY